MMKSKKSKIIAIVGTVIILVGVVIGVSIISSDKTTNNTEASTDVLELTKDYNDEIRASGNFYKVANIKINEITELDDEYSKYKGVVEEMKTDSKQNINKAVVCEISLFDENNKEVVLEKPITVYFYPKHISAYDGLYASYILKEDGSFEYINAPVCAISDTTIYMDLNESSTIIFLNYGDPIDNPYADNEDDTEEPELEPIGGEDEEWTINISEGYEIADISVEQAKEKYDISSSSLVDGINRMNDFDGIVINVATATKTYNENFLTTSADVLSAYNAFIYLDDEKDITMDYLNNNAKEDFQELFKFDYKECNGAFDVFYNLLKAQGLNLEFNNATFSKEFYALTNVREYIINNSEEIVTEFLQDIQYDEIIKARVLYNITQIDDVHINKTVNYIDKVSVEIYYKADGNIKSNSWSYTLTITTEEELDNSLENTSNFN